MGRPPSTKVFNGYRWRAVSRTRLLRLVLLGCLGGQRLLQSAYTEISLIYYG